MNIVRGNGSLPDDETESLSKKGKTSSRAKGVRGRCSRPVDEIGSPAKTGGTSERAKRARGRGAPVNGAGSRATVGRTSQRAKGVRRLGSQPVDETGSHDENGPSSPPHPAPPVEEEGRMASPQPEDHLVFECAGDGAMLEESSGLVSQKDPGAVMRRVPPSTPPPEMPCTGDNISAGNRQPHVVRECVCRSPDLSKTEMSETNESKNISSESGEVAVDLDPGVPDKHEHNSDEQHRKIKKRKKEKGGKVTEEEEINISLDGPGPALGTPEASQPTSGSTTIINNDQSLNPSGDQLEDPWSIRKPREKSKKKKPWIAGVITEGEGNVVDTASTPETSTLSEPTAVGLEKRKRVKDKMAPCSEDPEPVPEAGNIVDGNPFKHPADKGVALEEDASETSDVSQRTLGSAMSIDHDDVDVEHTRRKKKKKEKKRKVVEDERTHMSLDGPCPALEASDISQPTSGSAMAINNHDDDDDVEHRKRKKRKKENKLKVASGEEMNLSLDGPCPAVETFDVSHRISESGNSSHSLDCSVRDQSEDLLKPRKKSKKKKSRTNCVITEEEVVDTASSHETTLAETTAGFKKWKSKKDKMAPCHEDPETNTEADNTESEHSSFKHPADREVECPKRKRRKQKMSETTQYTICEDTVVDGSSLTSLCEKKRKRRHSFLSDDSVENNPKTNLSATGLDNSRQNHKSPDKGISTCDVDTELGENGETQMESLRVKTKKKKKREREASRVNEVCEGSGPDVRSSAELGEDTMRKKKKKKKDKVDRESESSVVVERETADNVETTVLIKKKRCKKNTRPPSHGSTQTEACVESEVTMPTDAVTISPQRCLPVADIDAAQALPNDGKKKPGKKRDKNASLVGTCDSSVPGQDIRTTTEPPLHSHTTETQARLKKKKNQKKDGRVMDRIEPVTDPGAMEAQHSGHKAEVTSQDSAPPESRTQTHHESSSSRRDKKKAHKRKSLFNQGRDFLDTESILT